MMKIFPTLAIAALLLGFAGAGYATNYYLSPNGNNGNSGLSAAAAWATLGRAGQTMQPGDSLLILGGHYWPLNGGAAAVDRQRFVREDGRGGAPGSPLVFKAYGDAVAVFEQSGGIDRQSRQYWYFSQGADYVIIDGRSRRNPSDSLFIKLNGRDDASYLIRGIGSSANWAEHFRVTGVEIDGNFPTPEMVAAGTPGGLLRYAIGFTFGSRDTIESCYIHDVYHPTGDIPPGDGTDRAQGTGEAVFIETGDRILIRNNTFINANHALVQLSRDGSGTPLSRYIKVLNNKCVNRWGGGIYFGHGTEWSLMEGNVVCHIAETTTKTKGAFNCSGSHNTLRNNVSWAPEGGALAMSAQALQTYEFRVDSCLIYNNTFFNTMSHSIELLACSEGAYSWPGASCRWNTIANNVFYRSHGNTTDVGARAGELKLYMHWANNETNWINPDVIPPPSPATTHWGGNTFLNNCIRKYAQKGDYDTLIIYDEDNEYDDGLPGGCRIYSLAAAQAEDPVAWRGNIADQPALASENPDSYGLFRGWWFLTQGSPCIDRGAIVTDTNGAHVNSLYPGYGWGNLTYAGSRPDIGAHEFNGEYPIGPSRPTQNQLRPGPR